MSSTEGERFMSKTGIPDYFTVTWYYIMPEKLLELIDGSKKTLYCKVCAIYYIL